MKLRRPIELPRVPTIAELEQQQRRARGLFIAMCGCAAVALIALVALFLDRV